MDSLQPRPKLIRVAAYNKILQAAADEFNTTHAAAISSHVPAFLSGVLVDPTGTVMQISDDDLRTAAQNAYTILSKSDLVDIGGGIGIDAAIVEFFTLPFPWGGKPR